MSRRVRPPGPPGRRFVGNLQAFETDRLGFLAATRDLYGGVVAFDERTTILHDPHLVRDVLRDHEAFVIQMNFLQQPIKPRELTLVTSRRQAINPGLRPGTVAPLGLEVHRATRAALSRGRLVAPSGVDPLPLLEEVVSSSTARHFFGAVEAEGIPELTGMLLDALGRVIGNPFALPASWPSPARHRVRTRHLALRAVVLERVERRIRHPDGYDDMASSVVGRLDVATHGAVGISDAIIGALLAAQRVPAASAAWMLALIADHSEAQERVRTEVRGLIGPDAEVLRVGPADQPYALMVVLEALRLYPATWILNRTAARDVSVGGYDFRAGHHFLMSPYVVHRDPAHFEDPEEFRPERWSDRRTTPAFLPFGHGTHGCPGSNLATVALLGVLTGAVAHWRIDRSAHPIVADPRTTLIPRGLELRLHEIAPAHPVETSVL